MGVTALASMGSRVGIRRIALENRTLGANEFAAKCW